jgi:small subunit ribosomal protein S17e
MGRIKTTWIKNVGKELVEKFPDKFSEDFDVNKKFLESLKVIEDKSVRNKVAGYIVRLKKQAI